MKKKIRKSALRFAFPKTIPVLTGYVFLGITYGILMTTNGFPVWLPILTALVIYTGSMEFLLTDILLSSFNPLSAMATAFMVGARHLFYGISMLSKYRNMGWTYFWVSFLDQMYWVAGAAIGAVFGSFITIDLDGLDFVMTAMFIVIFLGQWEKDGKRLKAVLIDHVPEFIGIFGSIAALMVFGPDRFIIPAMVIILVLLLAFRKPLEKNMNKKKSAT